MLAERAELATAPYSDGVRLEAPADVAAGIKADQWSLPESAIYPITDGTNAETTNSPPSVRQEWAAPVDACYRKTVDTQPTLSVLKRTRR